MKDNIDENNITMDKAMQNNYFYLPQDDVCFNLSVEELIKMVDFINRDKCIDILHKFNLDTDTLKEQKLSNLSGGETKKVYLALALSSDKEILILDEPTNSLDIGGKDTLVDMIKNTKKTFIIVSHDNDIISIADKRINMEEGKVVNE